MGKKWKNSRHDFGHKMFIFGVIIDSGATWRAAWPKSTNRRSWDRPNVDFLIKLKSLSRLVSFSHPFYPQYTNRKTLGTMGDRRKRIAGLGEDSGGHFA